MVINYILFSLSTKRWIQMFEKICIKPTTVENPTDIGFIAENMLYYQDVNIIVVPDTIPVFLNNCGVDTLIELLTRRNLNFYIRKNILGVCKHKDSLGDDLYGFDLISSKSLDREEFVFRSVFETTARRGHSKRIAQRIAPHIKEIEYPNDIYDHIKGDIENPIYVNGAIQEILRKRNAKIDFTTLQCLFIASENKYKFITNFSNKDNTIIDPSSLLLDIIETRGDAQISALLDAEIATTDINYSLMKMKFKDIYDKVLKSKEDLYQFNDFILNNGYAIREVINKREKNFSDFLKVLDKSAKFRDWLKNIDKDRNILKEYHNAVTKETWVDKLPTKILRWAFFMGAGELADLIITGEIGPLIGLGLSLGDTFILERIIQGWKPNVFVENKLNPFVKTDK